MTDVQELRVVATEPPLEGAQASSYCLKKMDGRIGAVEHYGPSDDEEHQQPATRNASDRDAALKQGSRPQFLTPSPELLGDGDIDDDGDECGGDDGDGDDIDDADYRDEDWGNCVEEEPRQAQNEGEEDYHDKAAVVAGEGKEDGDANENRQDQQGEPEYAQEQQQRDRGQRTQGQDRASEQRADSRQQGEDGPVTRQVELVVVPVRGRRTHASGFNTGAHGSKDAARSGGGGDDGSGTEDSQELTDAQSSQAPYEGDVDSYDASNSLDGEQEVSTGLPAGTRDLRMRRPSLLVEVPSTDDLVMEGTALVPTTPTEPSTPRHLHDTSEPSSGITTPWTDEPDDGSGPPRRRRRRRRAVQHGDAPAPRFTQEYMLNGEMLGRGAFAVVRGCLSKRTYKRAAVKIIAKRSRSRTSDAASMTGSTVPKPLLPSTGQRPTRDQIMSERDTLLRCKGQPNIVQLLDFYEDRVAFFFVFERLEGGDLLQHIRRRSAFLEREACLVARDIATGLSFLHSQGIVHRDVKPQNILCRSKSQVIPAKLCDFNLSYNSHYSGSHDHFLIPAGTLEYMSPEMVEALDARTAAPNSPATDVWGLGVIVFVILSGLHPFVGTHRIASFVQGNLRDMRADEVMDDIMDITYSTDDDEWAIVSPEAKEFVASILVYEEERPTIDDVLEHPWMTDGQANKTLLATPRVLRERAIQNGLQEFSRRLAAEKQRKLSYVCEPQRQRRPSDITSVVSPVGPENGNHNDDDDGDGDGDGDVFVDDGDDPRALSRPPSSNNSSSRATRPQTLS